MRCLNDNCPNEELDRISCIVVNCDGDFVCDNNCKLAYEKQKDHFFGVTIHSEEAVKKYLIGE